jgi:hypothetical protein
LEGKTPNCGFVESIAVMVVFLDAKWAFEVIGAFGRLSIAG